MTDNNNFDDLPLPDVTETEITEAAQQRKLGATPKGTTYLWQIQGASRDISDPEKSASGWMMLIIECAALKPPATEGGDYEPTNFKTKKWIMLPRTPSLAHLQARGYPDDLANKVLETFNPNGTNEFAITSFTRFVRAIFPEAFPKIAGFDKTLNAWASYDAEGNPTEIGTGEEGKKAVRKLQEGQVAAVKTAAANFFRDPSQVVGKRFYDGYKYAEAEGGGSKDFGELAGYYSARVPVSKEGVVYKVLDPTKNVKRD